MDQPGILINRMDQITPKHMNACGDYEYKRYAITEKKAKDHISAAFYEIPPGKANYPYHYHMANEEVFYIIQGAGIFRTPDGDREIAAGDLVVCSTGEKSAHKLINTSRTEMLVYLDVDAARAVDVCCYPDSNKVGLNIGGQRNLFFKTDSNVDYYEGE